MAASNCGASLGARAGCFSCWCWRGQPWGQENGKGCAVHHQGWVCGAIILIFSFFGWFVLGGHVLEFHCSSTATAARGLHLSTQRIWGLKVHLPLLIMSIAAQRTLRGNCAPLLPPSAGTRSPQVPGREGDSPQGVSIQTDGVGKSPRGHARRVLPCQGDFFQTSSPHFSFLHFIPNVPCRSPGGSK